MSYVISIKEIEKLDLVETLRETIDAQNEEVKKYMSMKGEEFVTALTIETTENIMARVHRLRTVLYKIERAPVRLNL